MSASHLISLLEDQGLLDPEMILELRRQVEQSKSRLSSEALVKLLVDNNQLTRFQATKLITQLKETVGEGNEPRTFVKGVRDGSRTSISSGDEDSLLPAEFINNQKLRQTSSSGVHDATLIDDAEEVEVVGDDDIEMIDDVSVVEPVEVEEISQTVAEEDKVRNATPAAASPDPTNDEDRLVRKKKKVRSSEEKSKARSAGTNGDPDSSPAYDIPDNLMRPVGIATAKTNNWDVYQIWGYGSALFALLIALAALGYWLTSKGANAVYERAVEAYGNRDYQAAKERYHGFAESYPTDPRAAKSRVLEVLASIREANDQAGDPVRAIEVVETAVPKIVNEPTINDLELRADLASALVSIASKLVERAEGARSTEDRKGYITKLDQHLISMRNPQYMPNAQRVTNEVRIRSIEESRERLTRDVKRDEDRVVAIEAMKAAIAAGDVDGAYQARRKVTLDYPQLRVDKQLLELLKDATELQKNAVKSTSELPENVTQTEKTTSTRSVLLVKQNGKPLGVDESAIFTVKSKQSLYGIRVNDGAVLWRRRVGLEANSDTIRLANVPDSDCLMYSPQNGEVSRINAKTGESVWHIKFGHRILLPSVDGDNVYVNTSEGQVYALDSESGQVRWGKMLPQKMDVGVGGGLNKPAKYFVGKHSNLYVLAKNDGACKQVYYLGHASGTVAIPPVYALGQLIVFENYGPASCHMHIFKLGDAGDQVDISQTAIQLKGHVVVPPSLDGRRMVVVTDLGEVNAYDIEPASSGDKVNRVAGVVANEDQPRVAWPAVAGNELWIAGNRLSRFQIQVSKQQMVRDWIREEEDQFVGRPFKFENYVLHSRILRGTQGTRVTAMDGVSGDPVWETDVGVPITAIALGSGSVTSITSQGALYNVSGKALVAGSTLNPEENPGRNQRLMNFESPVPLANGKTALLNLKSGSQVALLDPKGTKGSMLQVNTMQTNGAVPFAEPLAVGNGVVVPLDNSQLAYIEPSSGKQLGAPYQPVLEPNVRTTWIPATLLADNQTIIAATNQKRLYRLSSNKQLRVINESATPMPLVGRLAAVENTVCAAARGESVDSLDIYNGIDLSRVSSVEQEGRISWGPYALDKQFVAYSETSGLISIATDGASLWKTPIIQVALVGAPVLIGDDFLVVDFSGNLYRIEKATGKVLATVATLEQVHGKPVVLNNQLLLPGSEGVLVALPLDKTLVSSTSKDEQ